MTERPYYLTWAPQRTGATFALAGARGAVWTLEDRREVLDLASTSFQAAFGYDDARILDALTRQLRELPLASPKATFPLKETVSRRLLSLLALKGGRLFYTVSGAEAVENALKLARAVTGRRLVLARRDSYHGASMGALAVTGDWRADGHLIPREWTVRIPEPCEDPEGTALRRLIEATGAAEIAAFCLETVTGANGVQSAPVSWWRAVQALCQEHGILLILDEVTCGFWRTGRPFAFQEHGLRPDFVCMAKVITGGYVPFGALWTGDALAARFDDRPLSAGLTNYAHPLGLAALGAVLDHGEDPAFQARLAELSTAFAESVDRLARLPAVAGVRRRGLLAALDLAPARPKLTWSQAFAAGVHVVVHGSSVILAPPYVMTPAQLDSGLSRLAEVLHS